RGRRSRAARAMAALSILLAAAAGGVAVVAVREALAASPAAARWLRAAVEPLRRAGLEGYAPTAAERRRLAALGAAGLLAGGLLLFGPGPAPLLALAGPALATGAIARRRARYRRAVERDLPAVATAIADAVAAGRSVRAALVAAPASLEGPAAAELARVRSPRVEALAAALAAQQLAGGDLAGLLRRFALAAAERDRVAGAARAATAQARFTGLLVVAMPAGAALFAELVHPGFVAALLANPASALSLALAALLQLAGFVAIGRLSRVDDGA